jgi:hypothetical protein
MTRRTKVFFWLSTVPLLIVAGGAVFMAIYKHYLEFKSQGQASYFVVFHLHLLSFLGLTVFFFACGLISLLFDRRTNGAQ